MTAALSTQEHLRVGLQLPGADRPTGSLQLLQQQREVLALASAGRVDLVAMGDSRAVQDFDPLVRAAALVGVVGDVTIVLGATDATVRHPLAVAEDTTTVAALSAAPVVLCISPHVGPTEQDDDRLTYEDSSARLKEWFEVLGDLLRGDEVTYDGQFGKLQAATTSVRPAAGIPVWVSGSSASALTLATHHADVWCVPTSMPVDDILLTWQQMQRERATVGRPAMGGLAVRRVVTVTDHRRRASDAKAWAQAAGVSVIVGSTGTVLEELQALCAAAPVSDLVLELEPDRDHLDRMAQLERWLEDVVPELSHSRAVHTI